MKTEVYSNETKALLIQIAQKQKELFLSGFDMNTHDPRPIERPKRRLFCHPKPDYREILRSELNILQHQAINSLSDITGTRWWQIPWENVEIGLQTALYEKKRDEHWRFESTLKRFSDEAGLQYIILSEEGASQTYIQEKINQYETISDYSQETREKIMAHYDKATFDRNLAQAIAFEYSGAYVQSPLTEKIYDDVVKYYVSEGWLIDSAFRSNYEQTLYKDKYIEGISVHATSRLRAKGLFAVGCYKVDSTGCLAGFKSFDYYPVNIIPEDLKHILLPRRMPGASIFKLCEFISTDNNVKKVPFSLLSDIAGISETTTELDLLCVQSALFTLLSDKLVSNPT